FGPRMNRDVALREHRYAADAAVRLERVQMNVQQRGAGGLDTFDERSLDVLKVVEPFSAVDIDDVVRGGSANAVLLDEEVVRNVARTRSGGFLLCSRPRNLAHRSATYQVFLLGGLWSVQTHPQLEEGVVRHGVLPNQQMIGGSF